MEHMKADKIKVSFSREEINGIGIVLRTYMKTCMDGKSGRDALELYTKILKYARPYIYNNTEFVAVYFYRSEFSNLMKLLSFYIYASSEGSEEFYTKIGKCQADDHVLNAVKIMDGVQ